LPTYTGEKYMTEVQVPCFDHLEWSWVLSTTCFISKPDSRENKALLINKAGRSLLPRMQLATLAVHFYQPTGLK